MSTALRRTAKRFLPATVRYHAKIVQHLVLKGYLLRKVIIEKYLQSTSVPKLQVGCGRGLLKGWLNSDIVGGDIFLDASKKMPFDDRTFNFIFCEHFLEHLSQSDGLRFLQECYRILKVGGVLRITTPDLEKLIEIYYDENEFARRIDLIRLRSRKLSPCELFNEYFGHDHKFIYDEEFISSILSKVGFSRLTLCPCYQSGHIELTNVERHLKEGDWLRQAESMTIEAEK